MKEDKALNHTIRFRVTERDYERAQKAASKEHLPIGTYARKIFLTNLSEDSPPEENTSAIGAQRNRRSRREKLLKSFSRDRNCEDITDPMEKSAPIVPLIPQPIEYEGDVYVSVGYASLERPVRVRVAPSQIFSRQDDVANILITGDFRSGKTVLIRDILQQISNNYADNTIKAYVFGTNFFAGSNGYGIDEFSEFSEAPNILRAGSNLPDSIDRAEYVRDTLLMLAYHRREIMMKAKAPSWEDYNRYAEQEGLPPLPWLLFALDDSIGAMAENATAWNDIFNPRSQKMQRDVGLRIVYAINQIEQYPQRRDMVYQFGTRISLAGSSVQDVELLHRRNITLTDSYSTPSHKQTAYISSIQFGRESWPMHLFERPKKFNQHM